MANFGLNDLVLVSPYDDAWQTARSARAGAAVLKAARTVPCLTDAVAACGLVIGTTAGTARSPELPLEDWPAVAASLPATTVALLFGSEKTGLSVEDLSHCQRLARIGTAPDAPSMNLGQAVAVCAYELARRPSAPAPTAQRLVGDSQRELVLQAWQPLLEDLGVTQGQHRPSQTRFLRQMLGRWALRPSDSQRLLGIARQIRHRLRAPNRP